VNLDGVLNLLDDLIVAGRELAEIVAEETLRIVRTVTQRLRNAVRLAIVWPFILLLVAMPGYGFAQYAVPVITVLILIPLILTMTTQMSVSILAAETLLSRRTPALGKFVEVSRKVTRMVRFIIGLEILTGIYFSLVPIANDPILALIFVLIAAAIVCFVGINKYVVWTLIAAACVITLVFFLGGRHIITRHFPRDDTQDLQVDGSHHKKSPAGRLAHTDDSAEFNPPVVRIAANPRVNAVVEPEDPMPPIPPKESAVDDPSKAPLSVTAPVEANLTVMVRHCQHEVDKTIQCELLFESNADGPHELALKEGGTAIDNEGNPTPIMLGGITSPLGWNVKLDPGVWVKFRVRYKDPSNGTSTSTKLVFHLRWNGAYGDKDNIPIVRIS
jgi:hypothetical protein